MFRDAADREIHFQVLLREQARFFPPTPNPLPKEGAFLQGAAPPAPAK